MASNSDLFSKLDECSLFSAIVSFLPFKEAARTSVLSKYWKNEWKSTKNIEFNELFFVKPDDPEETRKAQRQVFLSFVNQWLQNYKGSELHKFTLKLSEPKNVGDVVEQCISFATRRGVKDLVLDFSDPDRNEENYENQDALFHLPRHFYEQRSLQSLKLLSCGFAISDLCMFHALKDVSFGWMEVTIGTVKALLSNCKMLESLSLKCCWKLENFDLGEEKLRLRTLVVDDCNFEEDKFIIVAPDLKFLNYTGAVCLFDIRIRRHVMKEADLQFPYEFEFNDNGHYLYRLLEDLYSVRVLTVSSYLLQIIPNGDHPFRMHQPLNVRHLTMKAVLHISEFEGIIFLLNSCPKLRTLTIEKDLKRIYVDREPPSGLDIWLFWNTNARVYKCLRSSLEEVELKGFRGANNEYHILKYFFQNGKVLKKVHINVLKEDIDYGRRVEFYREMTKLLLKFPRASRDLEISVS